VGVLVEVRDAPDHRRAGDEVVAVREQLLEEAGVLRVALHELEPRMPVVGLRDAPVLAEVVEADDLPAVLEELGDEVARDEPVRAGDEGLHTTDRPPFTEFQMSITGFLPKSRSFHAVWGAPMKTMSARRSASSTGTSVSSSRNGSQHRTSLHSTARPFLSFYESESRGSSESALNVMPRIAAVIVRSGKRSAARRTDRKSVV